MTIHVIAYSGMAKVSLALMQEDYLHDFLPWANKRIGIEGTLMRPPYSLAGGIEWIRSLDQKKGKDEVFAILEHIGEGKAEYRYVGHTGLHHIEWPDATASTGSVIGADGGRGAGYGTEAKLLLQYHAFRVIGLRKLTSGVKGFNAGSLAHLVKCGYRIVGRHRAHHFHEGAYVDRIDLEVFREEWEPIWEKYQATKMVPKLTDEQRKIITKEITT